jgi:CNT family concentrative nucleoside transporter|eukprot:COSAG01_NODE_20270_length_962_cov_2.071842_1_plen_105_part_00
MRRGNCVCLTNRLAQVGVEVVKLDTVFGYLLTPFAILMGVDMKDAVACGALLGQKTFINEFVAFQSLSNIQTGTHADFSPLQVREIAFLAVFSCASVYLRNLMC